MRSAPGWDMEVDENWKHPEQSGRIFDQITNNAAQNLSGKRRKCVKIRHLQHY